MANNALKLSLVSLIVCSLLQATWLKPYEGKEQTLLTMPSVLVPFN